jgi:Mce-associated membrane protein
MSASSGRVDSATSATRDRPSDLADESGAGVSTDWGSSSPALTEFAVNESVSSGTTPTQRRSRPAWSRIFVFGVLPAIMLLMGAAAGWLQWESYMARSPETSGPAAVQAASDAAVALLSYNPDTADQALSAAEDRLTGGFRDSYTSLVRDVVIPASEEKRISATATVPAAALVTAGERTAVVLLAVNQSVIVGQDPPSATASSVRVTLEKVGAHWLISGFEPV